MYFHIRFQNALKINKRPIFFPKGFYCSQKPVKFRWKHFMCIPNLDSLCLQIAEIEIFLLVSMATTFYERPSIESNVWAKTYLRTELGLCAIVDD